MGRLGPMLNCGHSLGKVVRDAGPMDLASFRWVEREDEPVVRWFGDEEVRWFVIESGRPHLFSKQLQG